MTNHQIPDLLVVYTTEPNLGPGGGYMFLGTANSTYDDMKLLWADDAYSSIEDSGEMVGETFDSQLLEEYGIKVTSPWRFEIDYFEADCEIVTPMEANDLTLQ